MSKYTTEVRYICENAAGYDESKGANNVDTVIANSWNKIFTTNCTFFDNSYKQLLCSKILKHYYLREIAAETVGIWKLWMNTKLEEIMPFYNQLYQSALLEFDPFNEVDYTKEHTGASDTSKSGEASSTMSGDKSGETTNAADKNSTNANTSNTTQTASGSRSIDTDTTDTGTVGDARDITTNGQYANSGDKGDRYSDTPQGTISNTDVTGNAYLTNVRLINENGSGTNSETVHDNNLETRNLAGSSDTDESYSDTGTTAKTDNTTFSETESGNSVFSENENVTNNSENSESVTSTDEYLERVAGKMSTTPYSELLLKYRETFLNIDMLVINEFEDLFFGLW